MGHLCKFLYLDGDIQAVVLFHQTTSPRSPLKSGLSRCRGPGEKPKSSSESLYIGEHYATHRTSCNCHIKLHNTCFLCRGRGRDGVVIKRGVLENQDVVATK